MTGGRLAGRDDAAVIDRRAEILTRSARLFRAHGFRETSIRGIAAAVGVKSASLYYHFENKDAILFAICLRIMEEFVDEVTTRLERDDSPEEAIAEAVAGHIRFDLARLDEVLVSARERRSLSASQQKPINALRARHRDALSEVIRAGIDAGTYPPQDPRLSANAILDLLGGLKEWFRPRRAGDVEALVARYQSLTAAMLRSALLHGGDASGGPDNHGGS